MKRGHFLIALIGFIIALPLLLVSAQENQTSEPTIIYDKITCVFRGVEGTHKCYTETTPFFSCSGVGSCTMEVYGVAGTRIIFRETCLNGQLSYVIGANMGNQFDINCGQEGIPIQEPKSVTEPINPETVQPTNLLSTGPILTEQVKCIFENPSSYQYCYTVDKRYVCSGGESCENTVSGEKGTTLPWTSSCGGYAMTTIDSVNEEIRFTCPRLNIYQVPVETVAQEVPLEKAPVSETLYYFYSEACSHCEGMEEELSKLSNYFIISIAKIDINKQPDFAKRYGIQGVPAFVLLKKDGSFEMRAGKTDYLTLVNWIKNIAYTQEIQPATILTEKVKCIFFEANSSQNCYTGDGRFGCHYGEKVAETSLIGKVIESITGKLISEQTSESPSCVAEVFGEKGAILTWKSSCGGYASTTIDATDENAEFKCISKPEVSEEQINGKGFKYAYWQCYDGIEFKSAKNSELCKPSEIWKTEAENSCKQHCNEDKSKCGINSFSISEDCYPDTEIEEVIFTRPQTTNESAAKTEEILICKDACPSDNKCYPFGYRKSGKFCSDDSSFKEQLKSEESCENNFECKSNLCIDSKCISSGLIQKVLNWLNKLVGPSNKEEVNEETIQILDCGTSSECMENAFKVCKPAKIAQGGYVSEIVGLEDKKCVLKIAAGNESMTCKIENYTLGTKNIGPTEQYCEGTLTYRLAATPQIARVE